MQIFTITVYFNYLDKLDQPKLHSTVIANENDALLLTCIDSWPFLVKAFRRCQTANMELIPVQNAQYCDLSLKQSSLITGQKYKPQQVFLHQKIICVIKSALNLLLT